MCGEKKGVAEKNSSGIIPLFAEWTSSAQEVELFKIECFKQSKVLIQQKFSKKLNKTKWKLEFILENRFSAENSSFFSETDFFLIRQWFL